MIRRFGRLKLAILDALITKDVLALAPRTPQVLEELQPRAFEFSRSADKITKFMKWLKEMERKEILTTEMRPGTFMGEEPWTNVYVQSAYQRGISRARAELRKKGYDVPPTTGFTPMGRNPITVAMNQPFHADRLAMVYTRTFSELQGITDAMDQQISRVLAQGMVEGRSAQDITRMITDRVDSIGITRARTLARTEVIVAHHQATINEYEQWGVSGVSVEAEWLTAGYNVCPLCAQLSRKIYSLEEIRGMIPAHPNCRCVAIPVIRERKRR
jgi:SPP1 gp7 family putative phage head morphogenesis protein